MFLIQEISLYHHMRIYSRMREKTIEKKIEICEAFCKEHKTKGFAVPTKLTNLEIPTLVSLKRNFKVTELTPYITEKGSVYVMLEDRRLGMIQDKHAKWLVPLLLSENPPTIHAFKVLGGTQEKPNLGLCVVIGNLKF